MSTENKSIVLFGPKGCGKTTNSKAIAKAYGLTTIVEADQLLQRRRARRNIPPVGFLLICEEPPEHTSFRKVSFYEAKFVAKGGSA